MYIRKHLYNTIHISNTNKRNNKNIINKNKYD